MKLTGKVTHLLIAPVIALSWLGGEKNAVAALDPFLGEISFVGFNFAPLNWQLCNGQVIAVSSNTALFSLLGNNFGGDGRTTFALPDMRGRVPIHWGVGPGLSDYRLGMKGGYEGYTIQLTQLPAHTHPATAQSQSASEVGAGASAVSTLHVNSGTGDQSPSGNYLAGNTSGRGTQMYTTTAPDADLNAASITTALNNVPINTSTSTTVTVGPNTGGGQPLPVVQPFTVVTCIIATQGVYPSRP